MPEPAEQKVLVVYIAMNSASAQHIVNLWLDQDPALVARAKEMNIIQMEVATIEHAPIES